MARQPSRPGPAGRDLADAEQRFAILNHEACARAPFTNGSREGEDRPGERRNKRGFYAPR